MTTGLPCPLCRRDAESINIVGNTDIRRIHCATCGRFNVTYEVTAPNVETYAEGRTHLLSGVTRRASDSDRIVTIGTDNISDLLQSVSIPSSPLENMDLALIYVSEKQTKADEEAQVIYQDDYPLAFAKDADEFQFFLDTLVDRRLLSRLGESRGRSNQHYRLTPDGWEREAELQKNQIDSNRAFVAMWFDGELRPAWEGGFEPALIATGYDPIRVDLIQHNNKIDDVIIAEIRRSGLLIADFTGHRGGVYFEAGFAMGLGIPVIWTCKKTDIDDLHFDTRQYNHIDWTTPDDLKERLQNRIAATIPGREITI